MDTTLLDPERMFKNKRDCRFALTLNVHRRRAIAMRILVASVGGAWLKPMPNMGTMLLRPLDFFSPLHTVSAARYLR